MNFAEVPHDGDVLGHDGEHEPLVFEPGTVGWPDGAPHFDAEDGITLVKVTLVRGGQRVLCRIGGGMFRIPKPGTGVMVGFPSWGASMPGSGVVVSTLERSPDIQFHEHKAKLDLGPDTDLVLKARSITLSDYGNRFVHLGPDGGIQVQDADGTGILIKDGVVLVFVADQGDAKTLLQLTKAEASLVQKGTGFVKLKDGQATVLANKSAAVVGGSVVLGAQPSAGVPVMIAGNLVSKGVFVSP